MSLERLLVGSQVPRAIWLHRDGRYASASKQDRAAFHASLFDHDEVKEAVTSYSASVKAGKAGSRLSFESWAHLHESQINILGLKREVSSRSSPRSTSKARSARVQPFDVSTGSATSRLDISKSIC